MRMSFALWLLILFLVPPAAQAKQIPHPKSLAFTRVTVIDVAAKDAKRALISDQTVIVTGDRIVAVGRTGRVKVPAGAQVIEAADKFLIPGLWDMHVHLFNNILKVGTNNGDAYFPLFIANGVTGVRDMWSDPDDLKLVRRWRGESEAGTLIAPRVAPGSSIVDGVPTFLPNALGVATPDEARRAVRMLKEAGAGFIKVYWNLSPEAYRAIADESKKLGIPFAGHVPFSMSAADASAAGQKSIEHLTGISETCSSKEVELRRAREKGWTPALAEEMVKTYDERKCRALFARFAKNGTWHTPTIALHRMLTFRGDEEFQKDSRLRYVPADEAQDWLKPVPGRFDPETRRARFRKLLEAVGEMNRAGVSLLAGTDLGNPFLFPGFSLHDELELFVRAGLTPLQALQTATINPAKYLGMTSSLGTVERGKLADLVLLDANPLESIGNTQRISAVVANGRFFDRNALDALLAQAEAAANRK
jgi:imidazolonepropionase-like amidohydrolase